MKEIQVLGVSVRECSLRESLKLTDGFLRNGACNTIMYISSKLLLDEGIHEEGKQWIERADLTVFGDASILKGMKMPEHRIHEVEEDIYLSELLKKIVRMKRRVLFVADSQERMDSLKSEILSYQENVKLAGEYLIDAEKYSFDGFLNEVNDYVTDVIISRLDYSIQGELMERSKSFVNASIWVGLLDNPAGAKTEKKKKTKWVRSFYRALLYIGIKKRDL